MLTANVKDRRQFNTSLQGARGLAAIMVVFSHIAVSGITDGFFVEISDLLIFVKYALLSGQYGVEIFFIISGYLITSSVIRHKSIKSFAIDRFIRIYPVFLPAVLLIFILGPLTNYEYFDGFTVFDWIIHLILNFLFVPGVYPMTAALVVAWSLSYEAFFYIIAALYRLFASSNLAKLFLTLFLVLPLIIYLPRAIFFVVGVFIYFQIKSGYVSPKYFDKLFIVFCFVFVVSLFMLQFSSDIGIDLGVGWQFTFGSLAVVLSYFLFVEIIQQSSQVKWLLDNQIMLFLGKISYSLYIWHTMILFGTKRIFWNSYIYLGELSSFMIFSLVSILLSILVSYISYVVLERNLVSYLSQFKQRI